MPSRDRSRAALRISTDYFMRGLQLISQLHEGDLLTGLVSLAIVQANVAHISSDPSNEFAGLDAIPPDSARRPVSILAVSASLGLPYETTRRHVAKLIKAGQCKRVKGGVVVPTSALTGPLRREMVQTNNVNLRRLFRQLRAAGISL